ncbi:MAG: hypothetical protein SFX73_26905 [Kofleriaceae bacterium]|nr:hypothetical protein [Kofleriaceae bacterium]
MSQRRSLHERLFRAIVMMGASLGASACGDDGGNPPPPDAGGSTDARVADASTDGPPLQDAPVDGVLIL